MIPALNISALQSYPSSFKISGATYPGDPHLIVNGASYFLQDNPKSTILRDPISSDLNSKFSGFKSQ